MSTKVTNAPARRSAPTRQTTAAAAKAAADHDIGAMPSEELNVLRPPLGRGGHFGGGRTAGRA